MVEIPIQNLYYLLCYAWDKLEERDMVNVDAQEFKDLPNLFAKVLSNGLRHLFKKGLDRNYLEEEEEYVGIKGKLLMTESLKHTSFVKGKTYCTYDDFNYNVLHNQILKSTLSSLLRYPKLEKNIREELEGLHQRFHNVAEIKIKRRHFSQVVLHRNNSFYKLLLNVALIIYDDLLFDQKEGTLVFKNFLRDEERMSQLFEKFIYNFYKRELPKQYRVAVEIIKWQAETIGESSLDYLPVMRTDTSITTPDRKLIIDAKYYKEAMVKRFDSEKLRSSHSYQMYAYMSNVLPDNDLQNIEGVLVYPTVEKSFKQSYKIKGYPLSFQTLNLTDQWGKIEHSLLAILTSLH